jgi:hypothetical protein
MSLCQMKLGNVCKQRISRFRESGVVAMPGSVLVIDSPYFDFQSPVHTHYFVTCQQKKRRGLALLMSFIII